MLTRRAAAATRRPPFRAGLKAVTKQARPEEDAAWPLAEEEHPEAAGQLSAPAMAADAGRGSVDGRGRYRCVSMAAGRPGRVQRVKGVQGLSRQRGGGAEKANRWAQLKCSFFCARHVFWTAPSSFGISALVWWGVCATAPGRGGAGRQRARRRGGGRAKRRARGAKEQASSAKLASARPPGVSASAPRRPGAVAAPPRRAPLGLLSFFNLSFGGAGFVIR